MRVITSKISQAFLNGTSARGVNTSTDGHAIVLHGHRIMWKEKGVVHYCLCGWNTRTTRDRINGVLRYLDSPIKLIQHKRAPYAYNFRTGKREGLSTRLPYSVEDFA
jgi:hypothetical protein